MSPSYKNPQYLEPLLLLKGSRHKGGFTLAELLVSTLIGSIILTLSLALLRAGTDGYRKIASDGVARGDTDRTIHLIRSDLEIRNTSLPLSLGWGKGNAHKSLGFDFIHGFIIPWSDSVDYGVLFPSEHASAFPSDRIGFFINLPAELADDYEGKSIAHVLYFTAITQDYDSTSGQLRSEDLKQTQRPESLGYSSKLFRLFTPPDRVYERLNLLIDLEEKSNDTLLAIPRGSFYDSNGTQADDSAFPYLSNSLHTVTLSTVMSGVAQFNINLSGTLKQLQLSPPTSHNISQFLEDQVSNNSVTNSALFNPKTHSLHNLLTTAQPSVSNQFIPTSLTFTLNVVPPAAAPSLQAKQWDISLGKENAYIGRDNVLPSSTSFSQSLEF